MKLKSIKYVHKKLGKERAYGQTDGGDTIEIDPRVKGKKELEIVNHESFHILFPDMEEEEVIQKSIILTKLLWRYGYRKVDNTNDTPLQDGTK